jgi:hypothetical protein
VAGVQWLRARTVPYANVRNCLYERDLTRRFPLDREEYAKQMKFLPERFFFRLQAIFRFPVKSNSIIKNERWCVSLNFLDRDTKSHNLNGPITK